MKQLTIKEFLQRHAASCHVAKRASKYVDMLQWWWAATPKDLIWIATRDGVLAHKSLIEFSVWCAGRCRYPFGFDEARIKILLMVTDAKNGLIPVLHCEKAVTAIGQNGEYTARAVRAAVKSLRDPIGGALNASEWGMEHWRFYHVSNPEFAGPRLAQQARWLRSDVEPFFIG